MAYSTIQVLHGIDGVRAKLSMYIGSTSMSANELMPRALTQILQELLSNALDEHTAGYGRHILITIHDNKQLTICDEGRGIPMGGCKFTAAINAFTQTHASGKFNGDAYTALGVTGTHGVGLKAVNAAAENLTVTVKRANNDMYRLQFQHGVLTDATSNPANMHEWFTTHDTGTVISFIGDTGPVSATNHKPVLGSNTWDASIVSERLQLIAYLNPDCTIQLRVTKGDKHNIVNDMTWHYPNGLTDLLINHKHTSDMIANANAPITIENDMISVDMAITPGNGLIISFANGVPTHDGGTHVNVLPTAICKALADITGTQYPRQDIMQTLDIALHVKIPADIIEYEGQTKEKLGTLKAGQAVTVFTQTIMADTLYAQPAIITKITSMLDEINNDKLLIKKAREQAKLLRGANKKLNPGVTSKLKACTSRIPSECELIITEGDSASNIGRDVHTQAVLPLRGKIKNVFNISDTSALTNKEINALITAIGAGVGKKFNPDIMRYHKILIATDADSDGGHIMTLLIGLFYRLCPGLIEAGRLYAIVPPLYKATKYVNNKLKVLLFYNETEINKMRDKLAGYEIQRYKGLGEMGREEACYALINPATRRLQQLTISDAHETENTLQYLIGDNIVKRKEWLSNDVIFN